MALFSSFDFSITGQFKRVNYNTFSKRNILIQQLARFKCSLCWLIHNGIVSSFEFSSFEFSIIGLIKSSSKLQYFQFGRLARLKCPLCRLILNHIVFKFLAYFDVTGQTNSLEWFAILLLILELPPYWLIRLKSTQRTTSKLTVVSTLLIAFQ